MEIRYGRPVPKKTGFTLIELMIVVAIIGILASIAIPKFASLVRKAQEGALKGSLGALRSALSIYYADMEGFYPSASPAGGCCVQAWDYTCGDVVGSLTVNGKYLTAIPSVKIPPYHANFGGLSGWILLRTARFGDDSATWDYNMYGPGCGSPDPNWGQIWVTCWDTDSKGTVWTSY